MAYNQELDGILLFNKGLNKTSFKSIYEIKKKIGIKKIGHSGTLDANASGLLIVAAGKSTKLLKYFINLPKVYRASIFFGKQTTTDDSAGNIINEYSGVIDYNIIKKELVNFKGKISQIPPDYSAVHINGVRSYKLALQNIKPDIKARNVEISDYKILSFENNTLTIEISCSSGTYIRSIARDLGLKTGYFAYMSGLVRLSISLYKIENSFTLEDVIENRYKFISPFDACENFFPIAIKEEFIKKIQNGCQISYSWLDYDKNNFQENIFYRLHFNKNLIAVVKYIDGNIVYDLVY